MDDDTKQCPYCAETIKHAAKVCRYCHMELTTGKPAGGTQVTAEPVRTTEVKARSGVWDGVKIGFGIFIVLPILLVVGYVLIAMFAASGLRDEPRHASSVEGYIPPTAEEMRTRDEVTSARNRGWSYAKEHAVKSAGDCAPLTDPNERAGCEDVAAWK